MSKKLVRKPYIPELSENLAPVMGRPKKFKATRKAAKRRYKNGKKEPDFGGKRGKLVMPAPDEQRCTAVTLKGKRCGNWTMAGETKCPKHGGSTRATPEPKRSTGLYDFNYHPRYTIMYMKRGYTLVEICSKFGITLATFERWVKQYTKFQQAWEEGLVHAEAYWVAKVRGNLENRSFNDRLFSMYMVNRFKWNSGKTSQTVDLQAKVSGVLVAPAETKSLDEWTKQISGDQLDALPEPEE